MSINIQNLITVVNAKLAALDSNSSIEEIFKLQSLRDDLNSSTGVLEYNSLKSLPEHDSSAIGKLVYVQDPQDRNVDPYGAYYFGTASGWQNI